MTITSVLAALTILFHGTASNETEAVPMENNMSLSAKEANQEVILEKNIIKTSYLTARSNPNPKPVRSICDHESAKSASK